MDNNEQWMPYEKAAVSYCYLQESKNNNEVRLQCPALQFDRQGEFAEIWHAFNDAAYADAQKYGCDGESYGCVTTAWQGENRKIIVSAASGRACEA